MSEEQDHQVRRQTTAARLALCARPYFSVFFLPAFVESQMAQVDRLRSLERGVLGSSSLCGGSFVAVFTNKTLLNKGAFKARGWWPRDLIIFKNIFLTVCVSLSGLGPSETHEKLSMRKMCDSSNEKQGEKLFLLWRHSALLVRPFSWLAKNRRQGNPLRSVRSRLVDTLRCAALPLQAPLTCTSRLSCLSSDRRESHWKRNLRQR